MSDLSEYEQLRLDNIKRNQAQLAALGLLGSLSSLVGAAPPKPKRRPRLSEEEKAAKKAAREAEKAQRRANPTPASRSSGRLRGAKAVDYGAEKVHGNSDGEEEDGDEGEELPLDYAAMPIEPEQLDDFEFETYIALRAWRLQKCRSIALERNEKRYEAYKICQNRTLCELVRRRRNDTAFAKDRPKALMTGFGAEPTSAEFREQVLEIWGIGPSKVDAYCPEMCEVLDDNGGKLQHSRDLPAALAAAAAAAAAAEGGEAAADAAAAGSYAGTMMSPPVEPPSAEPAGGPDGGDEPAPKKPVCCQDFFGAAKKRKTAA